MGLQTQPKIGPLCCPSALPAPLLPASGGLVSMHASNCMRAQAVATRVFYVWSCLGGERERHAPLWAKLQQVGRAGAAGGEWQQQPQQQGPPAGSLQGPLLSAGAWQQEQQEPHRCSLLAA